ncbi:MAG: hypothetical protein HYX67_14580, partial [Candidatus Melainabacteria bacterium]|nr:hypothetical protein [Candidatus Melainabacteria bacterium]
MRKSALYLTPLTLLISPLFSETINLVQDDTAKYDRNVHDQTSLSDFLEASSEGRNLAQSDCEIENPAQPAQDVREVNSPSRPSLKNGLNLWLVGEALLWQANEENLTYVQRTNSATSSLSTDHNLHDPEFQWDWGFRVGLGYNIPRDGWDISLFWTHMENHASGSQSAHLDGHGKDPFLQPTWNVNDVGVIGVMRKAHADWTVHLEQVDLGMGREYYIGEHLTIRPNGGMRADWIYQDFDIHYKSADVFNEKIKMSNRFFGFGFFAGLDTDWLFGKGFSLYGNATYAILLGFFDVDQKVFQKAPITGIATKGSLDDSFRCGRSIIDLNLGFKWCHLFHHSSWG